MDTFLYANNSKNKDLRVWNPRRIEEQDMVIISSGIRLSQTFLCKVICILKSVHHDVVGIMVTSESRLNIATIFLHNEI